MKDKKFVRKLIREFINKILKEDIFSLNDWGEYELETIRNFFSKIKNHEKITFDLIPKNQYLNALKEFMKFGKFLKFPENIIFSWKELILKNITKLNVLTSINGHTNDFPYEEFY